jgi:DNA replication protein DnaC
LADLAAQKPQAPQLRPIDYESASQQLVAAGRLADALRRWEDACPRMLQTSDWHHSCLAPYAAQIQRVLNYKFGPKGLIASGPTQRGKSRSMWQLMRRLSVDEGRNVRYYTAAGWFSRLQEQIHYGRDDAQGWVDAVARRPIVFIDDLGQEALLLNRAEWAAGWFFRFLDIRVGEGLPLFVTTNLTAQDMAGRAGDIRGDPLVRRLLDICEPVKFEDAAAR